MSKRSAQLLLSLIFVLSLLIISVTRPALATQTHRPSPSPAQPAPDSVGRAPAGAAPMHPQQPIDSPTSPLAAVNAAFVAKFPLETYEEKDLRYMPNTNTPDEWIYVASLADTAYFAGDFVGNDYSRLYVIDFALNELHTLDTRDGSDTTIGPCNPLAGQVWTGATGAEDGVLYASSTDEINSYLYTVDITNGAATMVGEITNAPTIIDIAINAEGEMYGLEISGDNLIRIDPASGAGTVVGAIGFDAAYAQGMDFEEVSGVLYLAAFNAALFRGELRVADTATGNSSLIGPFPDGAEADALAFTPPPRQLLQNPGLEDGWTYWQADGTPYLSESSHNGSWSVTLSGEECWVWQEVTIPADAIEVSIDYWLTGISSDLEWDNDILCGSIWDRTRQIEYADVCYGLTYFYHNPMEWKHRSHRLDANQLAGVAGQRVAVAFRLTQDWNPGYHKTSTGWVDDTALYVTRPIYDHALYLPLTVR